MFLIASVRTRKSVVPEVDYVLGSYVWLLNHSQKICTKCKHTIYLYTTKHEGYFSRLDLIHLHNM